MGFYAPAQLVADAKKHGVEVRPIDVNCSDWDCTLEPTDSQECTSQRAILAFRLGFRHVRGLARKHVDRVVEARADGPFQTFSEFVSPDRLVRAGALKKLSQADAFGSLQLDRQSHALAIVARTRAAHAVRRIDQEEAARVAAQVDSAGGSAGRLQHSRSDAAAASDQLPTGVLDSLAITPAAQLSSMANDRRLKVAGIVLMRQRPSTANGITFVTLEDETGVVNLIVRRDVWERYRKIARNSAALIAHGRLQIEGEIIHILVTRLEDLTAQLSNLSTHSRDFR